MDFGEPQGPQTGHFGVPLGSNLVQIRLPLAVRVPKGVPGVQNDHFGVSLGRVLGGIFDDF